jgi:hypothetical protein
VVVAWSCGGLALQDEFKDWAAKHKDRFLGLVLAQAVKVWIQEGTNTARIAVD